MDQHNQYSPSTDPFFQEDADGGLDFKEILFLFLRNWYWFVLCVGIAGAGAWTYLRYAETIYNVQASLLYKDNRSSSVFVEELIAQEFTPSNSYSAIYNEVYNLKSRDLMLRVVDSLKINVTYFAEGRIKTTEQYKDPPAKLLAAYPVEKAYGKQLRLKILNEQDFLLLTGEQDTLGCRFGIPFSYDDVTYQVGRDSTASGVGGLVQIHIQVPKKTAASYASRLEIQVLNDADILRLSLNDRSPEKAQDILHTLIEVYNASILEDMSLSGQNTLDFIDERLRFITAELFQVEQEVEGFRISQDIPLGLSESAGRVLDQLSEQDSRLSEIELQKILLSEIESFFQADSNRYALLPIASEMLSGSIAGLITPYNEMALEREKLLATASPDNPAARFQVDKLDQLRNIILLNVATTRRELEKKEDLINRRLTPLQARINTIPRSERQLLQIMRQQQIKETLFLLLLQRREETALALSAQVPTSRLIDEAVTTGLVEPKRQQIQTLALLLGFGIPGGILFLIHFLDNKVYSEKDIRQVTQTPFLGAIGTAEKGKQVVVKLGKRSSIAEMFRFLRTNLQFVTTGVKTPVYLTTSTVSGEGKSFVTANLGMSMALSGKKTLLVGLDLRKPKLSRYIMDGAAIPGMTNFLKGDVHWKEIIHHTTLHENLHLVPSGPVPPNPAELLMMNQVSDFFEQAKKEYDCILIDTSPAGLVTDAFIIGKHAEATLFVVHYGETPKDALQLIDKIYREQKLPNPGIILNGAKAKGRYGYGKYGGYGGYGGYGYGGYGYGYYEEDKKRKRGWLKRRKG